MMWQSQISLAGEVTGAIPMAMTFSGHYFENNDELLTLAPASTFCKPLIKPKDQLFC